MKRTAAIILALCMLVLAFASCGEKPDDTPDTTAGQNVVSQNPGETETESLYDSKGYLRDKLPEKMDFGKEQMLIFGWEVGKTDFLADDTSGDLLQVETFNRNAIVEERMNVVLEFDTSVKGDNGDRANYISIVENKLGSGEKIDMIACYSMCSANFATKGILRDLNEFSSIFDFSAPWWSSAMLENSEVNGHLYFESGSISATSILQSLIFVANLPLLSSMNIDDPRELVKSGEWTMDNFIAMCKDTYQDTNVAIPGKDIGDTFGYASNDRVVLDGFFASNGQKYLSADSDGKIILDPEFTGEKTYNLLVTLNDVFATDDFMVPESANSACFTEGRVGLFSTSFQYVSNNSGNIEFEYGYFPYPKADTNQKDYYVTTGFPFSMWQITNYAGNAEHCAYVMEALASAGYRTVQPCIYDKLKYRGNTDALNLEMFDLILSSKVYDLGRIFHNEFEWASSPVGMFRTHFYTYKPTQWYSNLRSATKLIDKVLTGVNSKFGY